MKILQVHNSYRIRGGEDVVVEREFELLRNSGHDVESFSVCSAERQGARWALNATLSCGYSRVARSEVEKKIRKFCPDIVHVHNLFPYITPSVFDACREFGVPSVQTLHNFRLFCSNGLMLREGRDCELCLMGSEWNAVRHGCYRGSALASFPVARMIRKHRREGTWRSKVDAFLAVTEFAKEKFLQAGLPQELVHVKPNFCSDLSKSFERKEGNYGLYLGRLSPEKGITTLLCAWKDLRVPLRIVGEGPVAEEVLARGWSAERGKTQAEAHEILAGAKFLVLPTECREGGIPLVVLEAFSLGVPVISSRFGAAGEIFRDGENGLLFSSGNSDALKRQILRLDSDAALRSNLARAGRRAFDEQFTPEKNLSQLTEIYAKVIASKRVR